MELICIRPACSPREIGIEQWTWASQYSSVKFLTCQIAFSLEIRHDIEPQKRSWRRESENVAEDWKALVQSTLYIVLCT